MLLNNFYNINRINMSIFTAGTSSTSMIPESETGLINLEGEQVSFFLSSHVSSGNFATFRMENKTLIYKIGFEIGNGKTEPDIYDYKMTSPIETVKKQVVFTATVKNGCLLISFQLMVQNTATEPIEISEFGITKNINTTYNTNDNILLAKTLLGDNAITLQPNESAVIYYDIEW